MGELCICSTKAAAYELMQQNSLRAPSFWWAQVLMLLTLIFLIFVFIKFVIKLSGMISTMTAFTNICTMSFSLDLSRQVFHQKNLSMSLKNLAQVLISQEPPIVKKFPTCLMWANIIRIISKFGNVKLTLIHIISYNIIKYQNLTMSSWCSFMQVEIPLIFCNLTEVPFLLWYES